MSPGSKANGRTRRRGDNDAVATRGIPSRGPNIPSRNRGPERPLGITQAVRRTLGFAASGLINSSTGAYNATYYNLNNARDLTGATAPYTGFSKYMQFYSKCFVVGARVRVRAVSTVSGSMHPLAAGLSIKTDDTLYTNSAAAIAAGYTQWTVSMVNPDARSFEQTVDVGRYLHKRNVLDDPQLFCTSGASVGQFVVAHVWCQALDSGTQSLTYVIEVEADAVFTDPIAFT